MQTKFVCVTLLLMVSLPAAAQEPWEQQYEVDESPAVEQFSVNKESAGADEAPAPKEKMAPMTLAVMDIAIKGEGLDPLIGESLSAVLAAEIALASGDAYSVISRNDLRQLIGHQIETQMLGCAEPSCFADLAKMSSADQIVMSSLGLVGEELVLTLELADLRTNQIIRRQAVSWKGPTSGIVDLVRPYVARLLQGAAAEQFVGTVEVLASEEAATVVVDDASVGDTPIQPVKALPIGRHRVRVVKDGFVPFLTDVVVNRNETTLLQVNLIDEATLRPWYYQWWVWASAGAVVGGGVALALLLRPDDDTTLKVNSALPSGLHGASWSPIQRR